MQREHYEQQIKNLEQTNTEISQNFEQDKFYAQEEEYAKKRREAKTKFDKIKANVTGIIELSMTD